MPKFNINKLRSAGLRYLAVDSGGQMWAYETMPVREDGYWRLPDKYMCPPKYGEECKRHWSNVARWRSQGRELDMPIYGAPMVLTFEDEPYDIVEHGLVAEKDLKIWPEL